MTNRVHLIAVPKEQQSLQQVLKPVHMPYAQYVNRQYGWSDHL